MPNLNVHFPRCKRRIKAAGFRTAADVGETLDKIVNKLLDLAIKEAEAANTKTLKPRHVETAWMELTQDGTLFESE